MEKLSFRLGHTEVYLPNGPPMPYILLPEFAPDKKTIEYYTLTYDKGIIIYLCSDGLRFGIEANILPKTHKESIFVVKQLMPLMLPILPRLMSTYALAMQFNHSRVGIHKIVFCKNNTLPYAELSQY